MANKELKYWIKMKIINTTDSWIMKCEHIGQAKLFGYILATYNTSDNTWNYDKYKESVIMEKFNITRVTLFTYLKKLVESELLIKRARGVYQINSKYAEFGSRK